MMTQIQLMRKVALPKNRKKQRKMKSKLETKCFLPFNSKKADKRVIYIQVSNPKNFNFK